MKTFLKKNWLLITAFALPLLIIMGVVISIYIPQSKIVPQYDFVYATCVDEYYYCDAYIEEFYGVENEKFVVREMSTLRDADNNNIPDVDEEKWGKGIQIYRYDVTTDSPQEITKEEAEKILKDSQNQQLDTNKEQTKDKPKKKEQKKTSPKKTAAKSTKDKTVKKKAKKVSKK